MKYRGDGWMSRRYVYLILIILVLAFSLWVDIPGNSGIKIGEFERTLKTILGLDLQGGMQVLLQVDLPEGTPIERSAMDDAKAILENRANGLGVSEVVFQVAGTNRIVGEFPGLTKTEQVISVLKQTGVLEFVDMGDTRMNEGDVVVTDYDGGEITTPAVAPTTTTPVDPTSTEATPAADTPKVWHTIMTGAELSKVGVTTGQLGQPVVSFELTSKGKEIFGKHTSDNVGKILGIVLDKKVISAPSINTAITEGSGIIEGSFTIESANNLAVQLRYGSLPIPLKVVESRIIGPTLGQDSLNKSMLAGAIGFAIVILFMTIYYRLPGGIAILAILIYAAITLALFKLLPVTLTLPGIAGFLLSTGGALDANILIFERLKEELRSGRTLRQAIELSWKRAWPSIRDSNIATIITSIILFIFGSQYGATIVKGFALTLALGVVVSMFSAIVTTRTFLSLSLDIVDPVKHTKWFGA
jgi:preprotein translocase subunit SecD